MPEIEMVDLDIQIVLMSDGSRVPITNFFDCWGEACPADEAVSCVAGPVDDRWLAIDLDVLQPGRIH